MACSGSSQVENGTGDFPCLRREKRSSSAAATISPSTTRAAAGSWKTALSPSTEAMRRSDSPRSASRQTQRRQIFDIEPIGRRAPGAAGTAYVERPQPAASAGLETVPPPALAPDGPLLRRRPGQRRDRLMVERGGAPGRDPPEAVREGGGEEQHARQMVDRGATLPADGAQAEA